MKKVIAILLTAQFMCLISPRLFSQSNSDMQEFGITTGAFTNFPANQNYLKEDISVLYVAPYLRTGRHEFSAGIVYPLQTHNLFFKDYNINPRPGMIAGYKFYIFNIYGRENLFVHYSFQYLRFMGNYDINYNWTSQTYHWTETDTYINNVIGLGYNLFFDTKGRFGLYYTLDYVISQTGYKLGTPGINNTSWNVQYLWNHLSTNFGFIFKLTSLKKKDKK
jgi:hypothetical protein